MVSKNRTNFLKYWEENIEGFSGFYDKNSEEVFNSPYLISLFYKKFIFPIEKRYMKKRFEFFSDYIDKNVKKGLKCADIGCGCGAYTKKMAQKCAYTYALDFSETAINLTKKNLTNSELKYVKLMQMDITKDKIPEVDLSISIGVLPYINNIEKYFENILPFTKVFIFNFLDSKNYFNILRKIIRVLDVRKYYYYNLEDINSILKKYSFKVNKVKKLATGFIIESIKVD